MQLGLGIVAVATGARADVVVRAAVGTTLGEVADQLRETVLPATSTAALSIDGHPLPSTALLGHPPLVEGALVEVGAAPREPPLPGLVELRVVGGPDAGAVHLLAPGTVLLGRQAAVSVDDPGVSREHCRLTLTDAGATVEDLGSTNGTWIDGASIGGPTPLPYDGLLRIGDSTLQLVPSAEPPAPVVPTGDGRLSFNRPPRLRMAQPRVQVTIPEPPATRERSPLPVLAILAPLVLGLVMWQVMGNASFLLFTLLSPVLLVGNLVTERRAGRRRSRRERAEWQAARAVAEQTLTDAVRADEQHRRSAAPDPSALLLTALGPRPRLWERRREDDDLLQLHLGLADQPAAVEADGDVPDGAATARTVPVVVDLKHAGVLGLAGPRLRTQRLARSLITQAAVLHSPRDLQLVVVTAPAAAADWEWAGRLPHCHADGGQDCTAALGLDGAQAAARIGELASLVESRRAERATLSTARTDERPVLVVLDGARALRALPGLAAVLADGPTVGVHTIAVEGDPRLLPEECGATAVVDGDPGTRLIVRRTGQPDLRDVLLTGVPPSYAEVVSRALAPLRDAGRERSGSGGLPPSVRWTQVNDLPLTGGDDDTARVLARWSAVGHTTTAVLGSGPDGLFAVDLARHGPHALVAGTTGAGKSELLQTLIASLAASNRPDALTFLLVDFKGGAAFGSCARLPHTAGVVTDLDGALAERALASLAAELRHREAVLARAGAKDLDDHRRAGGHGLPRLAIVVDEFATLAEELPDFVGGLVGIAQRGRSLGVHLVLATQRPEGVVSADIRANTNLRLCLAVTRESESRDVLDAPVAATISRRTPGRGYARTGHTELTAFQTARVGGRRPAVVADGTAPSVRLVPTRDLGDPLPRTDDATDEVTDLSLLVDACCAAADRLGLPTPRAPWLPPLPTTVTLDDLPPQHDPAAERPGRVPPVAYGLCDLPQLQSRRALTLDLDTSGHLLVVGSPRSGRTTALRTLAGSLAATASPDDVHVYAVDPAGGLSVLSALPHIGAVVGMDEPERLERLLAFLGAEVTRRSARLAAASHAGIAEQRSAAAASERLPHLLLLLDRWESFLTAYQDLDGGRLVEMVHRLLREGPGVGLHVVLTADRTGLVGRVGSMVDERLVLRLADRGDYAAAGLPTRLVPDHLPPGRGWATATTPMVTQVALLDSDPSGPAQAAALTRLAGAGARLHPPRRIDPLPARCRLADLAADSPLVLGVGGDELRPVDADLSDGFVIAGPPGSGRSTALLTLATQLLATGARVVAVAPRPSPLRDLPGCHTDPEASYDLAGLLAAGPDAIVVDDAELLVDSPLARELEQAVRGRRDSGLLLAVAGTTEDLLASFRGFVADLRRSRTGLLLSPHTADGDLLGVRLPRLTRPEAIPGRGLLCARGTATPVQVAVTG